MRMSGGRRGGSGILSDQTMRRKMRRDGYCSDLGGGERRGRQSTGGSSRQWKRTSMRLRRATVKASSTSEVGRRRQCSPHETEVRRRCSLHEERASDQRRRCSPHVLNAQHRPCSRHAPSEADQRRRYSTLARQRSKPTKPRQGQPRCSSLRVLRQRRAPDPHHRCSHHDHKHALHCYSAKS